MKKNVIMAAAAMMVALNLPAQTKRSDDFRAKYQLKEVVVMSRHNIRSPLTSGGAVYKRVTPYEWFNWSSPSSQLSLRGGVLETEMGQFFRKWLVGEGLLPENYRPEGDEVLFYANSRQRTFATAKYFSAGFLPFANMVLNPASSKPRSRKPAPVKNEKIPNVVLLFCSFFIIQTNN